jgi:hypothetical protein
MHPNFRMLFGSSPERTVTMACGGMKGGPATAAPAARRPCRRGTLSAGMKRTLSRTVSGAGYLHCLSPLLHPHAFCLMQHRVATPSGA